MLLGTNGCPLALLLLAVALTVAGCQRGSRLTIKCRDELDQPVSGVQIKIDGVERGFTGKDGAIIAPWSDESGRHIEVSGHHPSFYSFNKSLPAPRGAVGYTFVMDYRRWLNILTTVEATDGSLEPPLAGATIVVNGQDTGQTDEQGLFRYPFHARGGEVLMLTAYRPGYSLVEAPPVLIDIVANKTVYIQSLRFQNTPVDLQNNGLPSGFALPGAAGGATRRPDHSSSAGQQDPATALTVNPSPAAGRSVSGFQLPGSDSGATPFPTALIGAPVPTHN